MGINLDNCIAECLKKIFMAEDKSICDGLKEMLIELKIDKSEDPELFTSHSIHLGPGLYKTISDFQKKLATVLSMLKFDKDAELGMENSDTTKDKLEERLENVNVSLNKQQTFVE